LGVIYLLPQNKQKDYTKALESFQRIADRYPQSRYRKSGDAFIALIADMTGADRKLGAQHKQIEKLEQQLEKLEQQLEQLKEVDMNLKQKKKTFQ